MKSRTKAQRAHTKWKGFKRFGIELSNQDLKEIVDKIRSGHAVKVLRLSNTIAIYIVAHGDKNLPVMYDKPRHSIATILPRTDIRVRKFLIKPKPQRKVGSKRYVNHNGSGSQNGKNNGNHAH